MEGRYVRLLLLDLLTEELDGAQLRLAALELETWHQAARLEAEGKPAHRFCVDLAGAGGLQMVESGPAGPAVRYLEVDALPPVNGAGTPGDAGVVAASLERLSLDLMGTQPREQRADDRIRLRGQRVAVLVGLDALLRHMGTHPAEPGACAWQVHDISQRGFACLAPSAHAETTGVGALVALRHADSGAWVACAVRRKDPSGPPADTLVALEVLHYRPVRVELSVRGSGAGIAALYLPGSDACGAADALLLPPAAHSDGRELGLTIAAHSYRLRLKVPTRRGSDWLLSGFEVASGG